MEVGHLPETDPEDGGSPAILMIQEKHCLLVDRKEAIEYA
jgi:hypothetical protein